MESTEIVKLSNLIMDDVCKNESDVYQVAFFNIHNFEIEKKICLNLDKNNCNKFRINNLPWLKTVDEMELPDVLIMRKGIKLPFDLEKLILDLNIKVRYVDETILTDSIEFDKKIKDIRRTIYHARSMKYFNKEKEIIKNIEEKYKDETSRKKLTDEFILEFLKLVEEKDEVTYKHVTNVSKYVDIFISGMPNIKKLDASEIEKLKKAALVHDIGKLMIPNQILKKKSKLDDVEYEIIKDHVLDTAFLFNNKVMDSFKDVALAHHERYDGLGYPHGLKGKEIPYYARIISVLDTFEALTGDREYIKSKPKKSLFEVLQKLKECAGKQFDPEVVEYFIKGIVNNNIEEDLKVGGISR